MNSCNFFLSEFEEVKNCIYRVEITNAGMGLQWFSHHLFILQDWWNSTFYDQESQQKSKSDKSLQSKSNVQPAYCWVV